MKFDDFLEMRHSVRRFTNEIPDWRDIIECINVARFAPMAGGIYSLRFIVVRDKKKIKKISNACQQDFVSSCNLLVVACSMPSLTINAYGERGEIYSRQQAGAAIENFLLKIEEKGLATCWVGHFVDDMVRRVLKIPKKINIEAIFPIGYELKIKGAQRAKREKIDINKILFFEKYGDKKMKNPRRIEA
jgi:nitroreductase